MIPTSLSPGPRLWLLLLLGLWAALLFGGFALGPTQQNRRMPRWTRLGSSLALVVAAWSWWAMATGAPAQTYALWIALGMSCGLMGDVFLADVFAIDGKKATMGGLGAFAVGHLFYITALWQLRRHLVVTGPEPLLALVALWLIAIVGWYAVVLHGGRPVGLLQWIALPYALLLATTAGLSLGIALMTAAFTWLAVGAILFLLSDLILASDLFGGKQLPLHHDIVWLLYGPGQMLIVYSIGVALAIL